MEDASLASCLEKLECFRMKELKDILCRAGVTKQGKKQDLVQRITALLFDDQAIKILAKKRTPNKEEIVRLIEDAHRKMQGASTTVLATTGNCVSDHNNLQNSGEFGENSLEEDLKIRCLCENSLSTESLIKCDDNKCGIWQHLRCVIIPDKPETGGPEPPDIHYCEKCRLSRADPFLVTLADPLNPVKLAVKNGPVDGSNPVLYLEKSFHLTMEDKQLLSKQDYDVQAWCMLINDKVTYRMQWPQHAALRVNELPVRAINRPGHQLLGSNGRDDGPIITPCTKDGFNKISLEAIDARTFCFGVRLVKRRSLQQVRDMVPEQSDGESIQESLARVRRCIGGGTSAEETDGDNELVVAESHVISLRCPMSGSRIKVAGRFSPCVHLGGFDLDVFLEMNQRSRKWQCPICLENYSLENIIIDPFFNRITSMMQNCSDDITDVEIKPDGCWRVKAKSESERRSAGDLVSWHCSNGSRCNVSEGGDRETMETHCFVKQEVISESVTGQNNQVYDLNLHEDATHNIDKKNEKPVACEHEGAPMSISASGIGTVRTDEEGGYGRTYYNNQGIENNRISNAEVIELSDSEDDEVMIVAEAVGNSCRNTSRMDFNSLMLDTLPPVFELPDLDSHFGSEPDCSTGLFDSNGPFKNGDIAPATSDAIAVLSNNSKSLRGADHSLQLHPSLTPLSSSASMGHEGRNQINMSNGNNSENWISLRNGDSQSENNKATPDLHFGNQILPEKSDVDPMDDHATLLLGLTDGMSNKASRPRSELSFSCPRQNRSVRRRRTYLCIDSD